MRLPLALLVALLALVPGLAPASGGESKPAPAPGQPIYLPLGEAFVVNVADPNRRRLRFMQVDVQVMTHRPEVAAALEANQPPVRDAMIMLLAHQDSETMTSIEGRERIRQEAQGVLQQVLQEVAGLEEGVEAVYFTDFVIQ